MSDYRREKVLRVPCEKYGIEDAWAVEAAHIELFGSKYPAFDVAPVEGEYIDYVLERDFDADAGDWGRVRALSEKEKAKYLPVFQQIIPGIDMNDVHLVEFVWYDCTEAPAYYECDDDPFNAEV